MALFLFVGAHVWGDETPDLAQKVASLVRQLDATDPTVRDQAEADLAALGHRALKYLPEPESSELSPEQQLRLGRVYPLLLEARAKASVDASTVDIEQETTPLSDLLTLINEQTGNGVIDLRASMNQEVTDPPIHVKPGVHEFWPLLDEVARQAGLAIYPDPFAHSLGLAEGTPSAAPVHYQGAFRFRLNRVDCRRDFQLTEEAHFCSLSVTAEVEPRLRPIQVQLDGTKCRAVVDGKTSLKYMGPDRAYMTFENNSVELDLPLRFEAPPRSASDIGELNAAIEVILPSHVATFSFDDLAKAKDAEQKEPGLTVTLKSFTIEDEGVWAARLIVDREIPEEQAESYLQAELRNELYLESTDGRQVAQDGGMSSQNLGEGRMEYEYIFIDAPGSPRDYRLRIQIPTALVRVNVPFQFTMIPLP